MADPTQHETAVLDLFVDLMDPIEYKVRTYGTLIVDNTFSNNYTGKRGSALLIELINELELANNRFMENGPVNTWAEI